MIQRSRSLCLLARRRGAGCPGRRAAVRVPRQGADAREAEKRRGGVLHVGRAADRLRSGQGAAAAGGRADDRDRHHAGRGRARRGEGRGGRRHRGRRRHRCGGRRDRGAQPEPASRTTRQQQQQAGASQQQQAGLRARRAPRAWKARATPSNDADPSPSKPRHGPRCVDARGRAGSGAGHDFRRVVGVRAGPSAGRRRPRPPDAEPRSR